MLTPLFAPQSLPPLQGTLDSVKDPLYRFFEREASLGSKLVVTIRGDLEQLVQVCDGALKQTNDIRGLLSDLTKGTVPASWQRYKCRNLAAGAWVADLSKRLAQLTRIVDGGPANFRAASTSLGLLFQPQGFVTASRQAVAHATGSSLEQLHLQVDLEAPAEPGSFTVEGAPFVQA